MIGKLRYALGFTIIAAVALGQWSVVRRYAFWDLVAVGLMTAFAIRILAAFGY